MVTKDRRRWTTRIYRALERRWTSLLDGPEIDRALGTIFFPSRLFPRPCQIRQAREILIVKPDEIGDVVLATGFLRIVRRECPHSHITIAVKPACAELVDHPCFADRILLWNENWRSFRLDAPEKLSLIQTAVRTWSGHRPDWILIPRTGMDFYNAALYAWWTGATSICAHETLWTEADLKRQQLVSVVVRSGKGGHEIECHRQMLAAIGLPSIAPQPHLEIPPVSRTAAQELLRQCAQQQPLIALGVGARLPDRKWPIERFRQVVELIRGSGREVHFIVIGGDSDRDDGLFVAQGMNEWVVNTTGRLSLLESAAILQRCTLFVGNDSGSMHLAAAAGCRIVEISKHPQGADPTSGHSPERFGPVAPWRRILRPVPSSPSCTAGCTTPEAHCILGVDVESVVAAVLEGLSAVC